METTKKKLSLRKEEIASFDEQKNVKGGRETWNYPCRPTDHPCWVSNADAWCEVFPKDTVNNAGCLLPPVDLSIGCGGGETGLCVALTRQVDCGIILSALCNFQPTNSVIC